MAANDCNDGSLQCRGKGCPGFHHFEGFGIELDASAVRIARGKQQGVVGLFLRLIAPMFFQAVNAARGLVGKWCQGSVCTFLCTGSAFAPVVVGCERGFESHLEHHSPFGDRLLSAACILFCSPEKPLFCQYPTMLHPQRFAVVACSPLNLMGNDHGTIYQGHMPLRTFGC